MMQAAKSYQKEAPQKQRVVVLLPGDEMDAIDRWGIPAGMPSRTAAVRFLLKRGLETLQSHENQPSAG